MTSDTRPPKALCLSRHLSSSLCIRSSRNNILLTAFPWLRRMCLLLTTSRNQHGLYPLRLKLLTLMQHTPNKWPRLLSKQSSTIHHHSIIQGHPLWCLPTTSTVDIPAPWASDHAVDQWQTVCRPHPPRPLRQANDSLVKSAGKHSPGRMIEKGIMKLSTCHLPLFIDVSIVTRNLAGAVLRFSSLLCHWLSTIPFLRSPPPSRADSLKRHLDNGCDEMRTWWFLRHFLITYLGEFFMFMCCTFLLISFGLQVTSILGLFPGGGQWKIILQKRTVHTKIQSEMGPGTGGIMQQFINRTTYFCHRTFVAWPAFGLV